MLLVAGGRASHSTDSIMDTTEVLLSLTASQWTFKTPLPYKIGDLVGATLNNMILMTGIRSISKAGTYIHLMYLYNRRTR